MEDAITVCKYNYRKNEAFSGLKNMKRVLFAMNVSIESGFFLGFVYRVRIFVGDFSIEAGFVLCNRALFFLCFDRARIFVFDVSTDPEFLSWSHRDFDTAWTCCPLPI